MRAKKMIIMGLRKWEKWPNRVLNLFFCVSIGKEITFVRYYLKMGGKFIWEKKMLKKYALESYSNTMRRLKEIIYDRWIQKFIKRLINIIQKAVAKVGTWNLSVIISWGWLNIEKSAHWELTCFEILDFNLYILCNPTILLKKVD